MKHVNEVVGEVDGDTLVLRIPIGNTYETEKGNTVLFSGHRIRAGEVYLPQLTVMLSKDGEKKEKKGKKGKTPSLEAIFKMLKEIQDK